MPKDIRHTTVQYTNEGRLNLMSWRKVLLNSPS